MYSLYSVIENLINHKFYKSVEEIIKKITMYNSYKVLEDKDYQELMDLVIEKYEIAKEELVEETKVEEKTVENKPTETVNKTEEIKTEVISQ
ncbi:hypothetical protein FC789_12940 [Clostridium botulinum]|nr:hypothetical protein [Clostridium botulinum]